MEMDPAHRQTEERLADLEQRIAEIYQTAGEELQDTIEAYFQSFQERDEEMRARVEAGEITQEQYLQWRLNQIGRGERFEALRDTMAERYTDANEVALAYVNDATPGVYSLNRNYAAYTIESVAGSVGFTLFDESTVRRLIREDPDLMPYYPEEKALQRGIDLRWGKKQITASVTNGILQGKSMGRIAEDLQKRVSDMNRTSAVRAARTAVTGAQNAGRQDSYQAAHEMGIAMDKEWMATLDGRTRHSHRRLDGETVGYDETFSNGCRYPGDPQGRPEEVYNCRCTMIAKVRNIRELDGETPRITYAEWEAEVQKRQYPDIIGIKTANGIEIQSLSTHSLDRLKERSVTSEAVIHAVTEPLHIREVRTDEKGMKSQRFIGQEATVNINPDTGNLITVWKTGKRERQKYEGNTNV